MNNTKEISGSMLFCAYWLGCLLRIDGGPFSVSPLIASFLLLVHSHPLTACSASLPACLATSSAYQLLIPQVLCVLERECWEIGRWHGFSFLESFTAQCRAVTGIFRASVSIYQRHAFSSSAPFKCLYKWNRKLRC